MKKSEFKKMYFEVVDDLLNRLTPEAQNDMSKFNSGFAFPWSFRNYYEYAWKDYWVSLRQLPPCTNVCKIVDVGGFLGIFALLLKRMGYDATMIEALKYYDDSFDALYGYLREQGVRIIDYDIFDPDKSLNLHEFDFVSVIAVIEHYPYSLQSFFRNCKDLMKKEGTLFVMVPNLVRCINRYFFLLGKSPLAKVETVWKSLVPFTGHHHEYTMAELEKLAELSQMRVDKKIGHNNYCRTNTVFQKLLKVICFPFKNARDCISCVYTNKME